MIPVKAAVSPVPSPLGGTGQHMQKLQKGEMQAGRAVHTHTCVWAERQHDHIPYFFRKSD